MTITKDEFGEALRKLRPGLIQAARRLRRCGYDDAQDLVSEAVLCALRRLDQFDVATGPEGLRRWLHAILQHIVRRDYRNERCRPCAAPPDEMLPAPDVRSLINGSDLSATLRSLPRTHRPLVVDWFDGHSQQAIALRNRLHRNTVTIRLADSFAILRSALPDHEALEMSFSLFAACARRAVYRKPVDAWAPWRLQHPPEAPLRAVRRRRRRER